MSSTYHEEDETHGGRAGGATHPVNLDGAARVGVGGLCSQLCTRSTIEVGARRALYRAICVDLTNGRTNRRTRSNGIAWVNGAVDGDLVNITVGGHKSGKEEREKRGCDHDGVLDPHSEWSDEGL